MRTCVRECARECVRACMRSRPAVGVVRRETSRRLHGRNVAFLLVPRAQENRRGRTEKVGNEWLRSCGQSRDACFIYDIISEESAARARRSRGGNLVASAVLPASRADVNANTNAFKPAAVSLPSITLSLSLSLCPSGADLSSTRASVISVVSCPPLAPTKPCLSAAVTVNPRRN